MVRVTELKDPTTHSVNMNEYAGSVALMQLVRWNQLGTGYACRMASESSRPGRASWSTIYKHLRSKILDGTFGPGQTLPSQTELAREFSAAQNTVRAAYARLIDDGLAVARQGLGFYVPDGFDNAGVQAAIASSEVEESEALQIKSRPGPAFDLLGRAVEAISPWTLGTDYFVGQVSSENLVWIQWRGGADLDSVVEHALPRLQPNGTVWGVPGLRMLWTRRDDAGGRDHARFIWLLNRPVELWLTRDDPNEY
jgi:DNA-binding transcriptional regulator YhcF (GntR family)